jgi:hypothetical protein
MKEELPFLYNSMKGSGRHYTKSNKPDSKRHSKWWLPGLEEGGN